MNGALWAKFRVRFLETARRRLDKIDRFVEHGAWNDANEIVDELHALAGEASTLGRFEIATAARRAEAHARALDPGEESARRLASLVADVRALVFAPEPPG